MVIVYYFHFRRHSFWFSSCFFLFFATHFAHFRTTFSNGRSYICPFNTKKLGCFLSPSGGFLKKCFTAVFPPPSSSSLFVKSNAQSPNLLNFYLCGEGGGLYVSEKNKLLSGGYIIRLQQQQHKNRIYQSREIDATDERNKTKSYNLDMFLFFPKWYSIEARELGSIHFVKMRLDYYYYSMVVFS